MPRRESGQSEASREERFREIFFEYHRPVVSFFQRRGSTYEESLDLAQETFLSVFKGMGAFRGEASLGTWVYTIASHVRSKALRTQAAAKRRVPEEHLLRETEAGEESLIDVVADDSGALHGMLAEERVRVLREALLELPPQMRRCTELRLYSDLKYDEIANLMRISIQTVKSHLFEAKQRVLEGVRLGRAVRALDPRTLRCLYFWTVLKSGRRATAQLARLSEDDVRARLVEVAARLGRSIDQLGDPDVVEACIEAVKGRRR